MQLLHVHASLILKVRHFSIHVHCMYYMLAPTHVHVHVCAHVTHHVLHAYGYFIVDTEVAKESHDVRRVALMKHLQFTHNLITNSWLDVQHDHLKRKVDGGKKRKREREWGNG